MKKSLIYSVISLIMAATPIAGVFAEGSGTGEYNHNVTVGEVDETIYSVDIFWGDMIFDWKYNATTKDYNFKAHIGCGGGIQMNATNSERLNDAKDSKLLYADSECTTLQTADLINSELYYQKNVVSGGINVNDNSINGKIKASANFTPDTNYAWSVGKFYEYAAIDISSNEIEYSNELSNGLAAHYVNVAPQGYVGYLKLEKNQNAEIMAESINPDDKIGTITIEISPDTE